MRASTHFRATTPIVVSTLLLTTILALGVGYLVGNRVLNQESVVTGSHLPKHESLRDEAIAALMPQLKLHAAAATSGDSFAMATGPIDSDVEGLYVLDFITGDLQCSVLNFRSGKFGAVFRANVMRDLGMEAGAKNPKYLITTGTINFPRGASQHRPGNSVVYVLDVTTGAFAAYGIPWRREIAASGRGQVAAMMLLDVGRARTLAIRE